MIFKPLSIAGCLSITPRTYLDDRGVFVKTYERELFEKNGLATTYVDEFFSCSSRGVFRGFHFQVPPYDQVKLISCMHGVVMDIIVDLRIHSPTYGCHEIIELCGGGGDILYLPEGIAHGFLSMTNSAVMHYKATKPYSSTHDTGVRWDSLGISWPIENLVISERDRKFVRLKEYKSPFNYSVEDKSGND